MKKINILCATDENYAAYCGVMLTSLLENNRNNFISIYIIGDSLSDESKKKYVSLQDYYHTEIHIITPPVNLFNECPIRKGDHVSIATYYRIALGEFLPKNIKKIIYLDCDILVNTDLSVLWNFSLEESPCGAVIDSYCYDNQQRLKIDSTYFNAGVLLIDVEKFREDCIMQKCFDILQKDPDRIKLHDQDMLNIVIGNKVKLLPVRFNMLSAFLLTEHCGQPMSRELHNEIVSTIRDSSKLIIHFEAFPKPWQKGYMIEHPFAKLWNKYRLQSMWKGAKIIDAPLKTKIRSNIMSLLWTLGIKKRPKYYLI